MEDSIGDIAHGFVNVLTRTNRGIADVRLAICALCPDYKNGICKRCKCVMKIKATLQKKKCPINKW